MKVSVKLNEKEVFSAEMTDELKDVSSEEFMHEFVKTMLIQAYDETKRAGIDAEIKTIDIQMVPVEGK